MDFFRSADMELYEVSVPKDSIWETMDTLGRMDSLHFINLNKDVQIFNLVYANRVKRCDDSLRRISTIIEMEAVRLDISMKIPYDLNSVNNALMKQSKLKRKSPQMIFDLVEDDIKKQAQLIEEQKHREEQMHNSFTYLLEKKAVLNVCSEILNLKAEDNVEEEGKYNFRMRDGDQQLEVREQLLGTGGLRVTNIAGTVQQSEKDRLQKLIFRATRGTALTYFKDIEEPIIDYRGNKMAKTVYIVIFQEGEYTRERLTRILDSFLGHRFQFNEGNFTQETKETVAKLKDVKKAIKMCYNQLESYMKTINSLEGSLISKIQLYKFYLIKEKSIYETVDKMRLGRKFFIGAFWLPASELKALENELSLLADSKNIRKPQITKRENVSIVPPTYIRTNDFTYPFQEITNTYGVPCYKEVNPSYFGIVTFPFLFGVMFGDIAHGTLLFLFAAVLCLHSDHLQRTGLRQMLPYRYLLFLMGTFAMFCGWCYNDLASIPVEVFPSCYDTTKAEIEQPEDCVYPFGVDHTWYLSGNHLTYLNSLKMKISVILGVAQMSLGICMKAFNSIYFKRYLDFKYEFIPQIILMLCLFGWMDLLIIVKWTSDWEGNENRAPGIVSIMISMFLNFGEIDQETTDAIVGDPGTQQTISIILLIISLISIPSMLLIKPYFLFKEMSQHPEQHDHAEYIELSGKDEEEKVEMNQEEMTHQLRKENEMKMKRIEIEEGVNLTQILNTDETHEDHGIGEIFIHQLIETIEFALGTVSNTASYLRLWALSLAHGQLAAVFFEKLLSDMALSGKGSGVLLFLLFPVFASFSFFVLMCMDSMECFLHTLRLHWVEFQNKFYKGNGYRFMPMSFNYLIATEIENMNPRIKIEEEVESEVDDNSQELQTTLREIGKEDDKEDDEEKKRKLVLEDEKTKKKDLIELLKKYSEQVDLASLDDAKERLANIRRAIQVKHDTLTVTNIDQVDPDNVYQPKVSFDDEFAGLKEAGVRTDTDITQIEKTLRDVRSLIDDENKVTETSIEELEGKLKIIREANKKIGTIFTNLDNLSSDQGITVAKLDAFLVETKPIQIERCDITENLNQQDLLRSRLEVCNEKLENLRKEASEQHWFTPNKDRAKATKELKSNLHGWRKRYIMSNSKFDQTSSKLENLKERIERHEQNPLDMKEIRETMGLKATNLSSLEAEIQEINILIDEIQLAELKWAEFEDKEALQKKLTEEFEAKTDNLLKKLQEVDVINKILDTSLIPLKETLEKTIGNKDYSDEQEVMSKKIAKVERKILEQEALKEQIEGYRAKIENYVSKTNESMSSIPINDLEEYLKTENDIILAMNPIISALNELLEYTKQARLNAVDLHTIRNFKTKSEQFDIFKEDVYNVSEKFKMLHDRIDDEQVDEKLQDNQKGIVAEAEEKLGPLNDKISELEDRASSQQEKFREIDQIMEENDPTTTNYDILKDLIQKIQELEIGGEFTLEPIEDLNNKLDEITKLLNEIDHDQENDVNKGKLKDLKINADKLLKDLKFIKSVFDSTDGYTTTEEEDKTYDAISHDLNVLIIELKGIIQNVKDYKEIGNFDKIDKYRTKTLRKISTIQEALEKHRDVLENIDWEAKLERRKNQLYEAEAELNDIIEDGKKIHADVKKIHEKASANPKDNQEIIDRFGAYSEKVEENLSILEEQKTEFSNIYDMVSKYEDLMIVMLREPDMKHVAKLMKQNKDIKESINNAFTRIDSLDGEIDKIADDRDANIKLAKKKYKAKKGDEVDELLAKLINSSDASIDIKRTGDGKYMIGGKTISAKVTNGKLLVRVGGGYMTMEEYMKEFGQYKLDRHMRKTKREIRQKAGHKVRALRTTGDMDVVGSADLLKSLKG